MGPHIQEPSKPVQWEHTSVSGALPRIPQSYPSLLDELSGSTRLERDVAREAVTPTLDLLLLPTLGCFQPGYLLACPSRAALSFAELSAEELAAVEKTSETWRMTLARLLGDSVIAEHGSSAACDKSAACVSQAHLHMIPLPGLVAALRERYHAAGGNPDETFSSLRELAAAADGRPYVLLSPGAGCFEVWFDVERFPRQFVRREAAELLGIPEFYNWRSFPFVGQMELTRSLLRPVFEAGGTMRRADQRLDAFAWHTPYDIPALHDPKSNPHVTIFGERDVERLIFFAACRAQGIAEEALDQLRRLHKENQLSPAQILRARAVALGPLRQHFQVCTGRAAMDFLSAVGMAPENPPNLYGIDSED